MAGRYLCDFARSVRDLHFGEGSVRQHARRAALRENPWKIIRSPFCVSGTGLRAGTGYMVFVSSSETRKPCGNYRSIARSQRVDRRRNRWLRRLGVGAIEFILEEDHVRFAINPGGVSRRAGPCSPAAGVGEDRSRRARCRPELIDHGRRPGGRARDFEKAGGCCAASSKTPLQRETKTSEAQKPAILIAEDDRVSRRALQAFLQAWGYRVVVAADGLEALRVLKVTTLHPSPFDWMMPELSGPRSLPGASASIRRGRMSISCCSLREA